MKQAITATITDKPRHSINGQAIVEHKATSSDIALLQEAKDIVLYQILLDRD